jgi:hypothetical protein
MVPSRFGGIKPSNYSSTEVFLRSNQVRRQLLGKKRSTADQIQEFQDIIWIYIKKHVLVWCTAIILL